MAIPIRHRIQEWFADHFDGVQYPNIQSTAPKRRIFEFKYKMPWWQRIVIIQWGIFILLIGGIALGIGLLFAYILLKVIFSS